jgi:hypothetical protein
MDTEVEVEVGWMRTEDGRSSCIDENFWSEVRFLLTLARAREIRMMLSSYDNAPGTGGGKRGSSLVR